MVAKESATVCMKLQTAFRNLADYKSQLRRLCQGPLRYHSYVKGRTRICESLLLACRKGLGISAPCWTSKLVASLSAITGTLKMIWKTELPIFRLLVIAARLTNSFVVQHYVDTPKTFLSLWLID